VGSGGEEAEEDPLESPVPEPGVVAGA